jgi:uncharacterized protein (DUF1330 family)
LALDRAVRRYGLAVAIMFLAVDSITDLPLLREYQAGVRPILALHPHEMIAYDEAAQPLEGIDTTKRVVAIRFETAESFRTFYDSPEYQGVLRKRLSATDGFALLVNVP